MRPVPLRAGSRESPARNWCRASRTAPGSVSRLLTDESCALLCPHSPIYHVYPTTVHGAPKRDSGASMPRTVCVAGVLGTTAHTDCRLVLNSPRAILLAHQSLAPPVGLQCIRTL